VERYGRRNVHYRTVGFGPRCGSGAEDVQARKTIFVVEDDPLVSMVVTDTLEDAGYAVQIASNGRDAIRHLQGCVCSYDALLSDIRLGDGPDGWEVARTARALRPDLPIIYMTGDSGSMAGSQAVPSAVVLQKPHFLRELLTALELFFLDRTLLGKGDRGVIEEERFAGQGALWGWAYVSTSVLPAERTEEELEAIMRVSKRNNAAADVSGALMMARRTFAQTIEGPQKGVDAIRRCILADRRHKDIITIHHGAIARRQFESWSLAYAGPSSYLEQVLHDALSASSVDHSMAAILQVMDRLAHYPAHH